MLVVGDREAADRAVAVRSRAKGDLGARALDQFVTDALAEVRSKALS
jgi:threonyl-tRNA synthetase